MMPPLCSPPPPIHLHHHTHSPLTSMAFLCTVPTALLRLRHHAIAMNHRFRLVKGDQPMALGTSSAAARLSFTFTPPGAVVIQPRLWLQDLANGRITSPARLSALATHQLNTCRQGNGQGRKRCWRTQQLSSPDTTIHPTKQFAIKFSSQKI